MIVKSMNGWTNGKADRWIGKFDFSESELSFQSIKICCRIVRDCCANIFSIQGAVSKKNSNHIKKLIKKI